MQFVRRGYFLSQGIFGRFIQWLSTLLEGKKQKSTIASLDGVRAIACLSVVVYHLTLVTTQDIRLWYPQNLPPLVSTLMYAGDTGVTLFFVLSGFLLFMPYAKALLFDGSWPSTWHFYLRRALRILPAYYATLLLMILIYRPDFLQAKRLGDLFMFLILFMDSTPTAFKQINGPFWSLAVEWQFYLLLPLLALAIGWLVRRVSQRWRLVALIGCLLLLVAWGLFTRFLGIYLTEHPDETFHLPRTLVRVFLFFCYGVPDSGLHGKFLEDFAVGMLISTLYIYSRALPSESRFRVIARRTSPWLFAGGLLWLLFMFMWKYDQKFPHTWSVFDPWFPLLDHVGELGYASGYGLCIAAILFGANWLKQPFEWTPLRWIGLLSFGIYMWHLKLLEDFTTLVVVHLDGWKNLVLYGLYWLCFLFLILPCMLVLFALVEKPWIELGDKWTRRNRGNQESQSSTRARHPDALDTATTERATSEIAP
jgi:peptidoglycan/LPS O-acetylase OafA/YrhL